jgi:hypothetical protein
MNLPQVKTAVKVWEKAFKAKYEREPTKEDIKKDPSGIGASSSSLAPCVQADWIQPSNMLYIGNYPSHPQAEN